MTGQVQLQMIAEKFQEIKLEMEFVFYLNPEF
jgi:hypothetical protein